MSSILSAGLPARLLRSLILSIVLAHLCAGCSPPPKDRFAQQAPERKILSAFPLEYNYSAGPSSDVLLAQAPSELHGFSREDAKPLWTVAGGIAVGNTDQHVVATLEKAGILQLIEPATGEVARGISPIPTPLTSQNSLDRGMAFTEEMYLTTRALYSSVWDGGNDDKSFAIGVTAKKWGDADIAWFVPPVRPIVALDYRPRVIGKKILLLDSKVAADGPHSYQILDLATGKQAKLVETPGEFYDLPRAGLVERTPTFMRRLDPISGRELWKRKGDYKGSVLLEVGSQLSVATPRADRTTQLQIVAVDGGKLLAELTLPDLLDCPLRGGYVLPDNSLAINLAADPLVDRDRRDFDYWVGWDEKTSAPLWRTSFASRSASSLMRLAPDKVRFEP